MASSTYFCIAMNIPVNTNYIVFILDKIQSNIKNKIISLKEYNYCPDIYNTIIYNLVKKGNLVCLVNKTDISDFILFSNYYRLQGISNSRIKKFSPDIIIPKITATH